MLTHHAQQSKKANFDATHELEELLLEDNPLKARKRKEDVDINTLSPELRLMEEHFLPFDHLKQRRKSYFKAPKQGTDNHGTTSQVSNSTGLGLADQPLAEMNVAGGSLGGTSTTSVAIASPTTGQPPGGGLQLGGGGVGLTNGAGMISGGHGPMGEKEPGADVDQLQQAHVEGTQEVMSDQRHNGGPQWGSYDPNNEKTGFAS